MNAIRRVSAVALAISLALAMQALSRAEAIAATPDPHCSHDSLAIDGADAPVAVSLCATKTDAKSIAVTEIFVGKSASFSHATTIDVFPGEESSRGIDDVPLAQLGLKKTIHLTMRYKAGAIVLEHALLLPGAVPLK